MATEIAKIHIYMDRVCKLCGKEMHNVFQNTQYCRDCAKIMKRMNDCESNKRRYQILKYKKQYVESI